MNSNEKLLVFRMADLFVSVIGDEAILRALHQKIKQKWDYMRDDTENQIRETAVALIEAHLDYHSSSGSNEQCAVAQSDNENLQLIESAKLDIRSRRVDIMSAKN